MKFPLNKITTSFSAALGQFIGGTHDDWETILDLYLVAGLSIPDDNFGMPSNNVKQGRLTKVTARMQRGIRKIAALLDAASGMNFADDDALEDYLRKAMKQDAEMTAAKDFLKTVYEKNSKKLEYPSVAEIQTRNGGTDDAFGDFISGGANNNNDANQNIYESVSAALGF